MWIRAASLTGPNRDLAEDLSWHWLPTTFARYMSLPFLVLRAGVGVHGHSHLLDSHLKLIKGTTLY